MKVYKEAQAEVLDYIKCDICNRHIDNMRGYLEFKALWGYGSSKDMTKWTAEYCEGCADKIKDFIESKGGKINAKSYLL